MILARESLAKAIDRAVFPGTQGGPLMHVIAAKAICLQEALQPAFADYQRRTVENAKALADGLLRRGMRLVSGGTDNHLLLLDLRGLDITGKELEHRLDSVYITVNKNTVPNDPQKPFVTSGVRIGTPAVTTRGLGTVEMDLIADCIYRTATDYARSADDVRRIVTEMTDRFPVYA